MKRDARRLANVLGISIQGDLGDLTMYRSIDRRVVIFPWTQPKEPPTLWQNHNRQKFKIIASAWSLLDQAARDLWELAAVRAWLRITGYNLFTWWMLKADRAALATIQRQSGVNLEPLPAAPLQ